MADINIKILTPATEFALLTLAELKVMLGIPDTDTTSDEQLTQQIDWYSAYVSQITNRVFAREKVNESWRDLNCRRVFLSHWPVAEADIESVEAPRGTLVAGTDYELEERSGKVSLFGSRAEPIAVTYTGGFNLPAEAPDDLKAAAAILIRQERMAGQRALTSGIRSISHKEARVMFFDPLAHGSTVSEDTIRSVHAMLYHYSRLEV